MPDVRKLQHFKGKVDFTRMHKPVDMKVIAWHESYKFARQYEKYLKKLNTTRKNKIWVTA